MLKVGLTGGIGSGKSTVAEFFQLLGVPVYSSDIRARVLIESDERLVTEIKKLFGEQAYENGRYQAKWVADQVFSDQSLLTQLNGLVHPAVASDFEAWAHTHRYSPYGIKEAALITSGKGLDKVIYVWASEETRIRRTAERDPHRNYDAIQNIMRKQPSEKEFREIADFVIDNETELIIPQVLEINARLTA